MLALSIILDIIQRTFSPPDNTLQVFNASSPENHFTKEATNINLIVLLLFYPLTQPQCKSFSK
jgi:hypothetical protein